MVKFTSFVIIMTFISEVTTQNDHGRWPEIGIKITECLKNTTKPVIKTENLIKLMIEKIPRFLAQQLTAENQFLFTNLITATAITLNGLDDYLIRSHNYEHVFKTKLFLRLRDRAVNLNYEYIDHKPYAKLYNLFCTDKIKYMAKTKFDRDSYAMLLYSQEYTLNSNVMLCYVCLLLP